MAYRIEFTREAESVYAWLRKRDEKLFRRIDGALHVLIEDPYQGKALRWDLQGRYFYRVGSHRIIYKIIKEKLIVYVLDIGHRREIYRRR